MGGALHPVRDLSVLKIMISVSGIANVPLYCASDSNNNTDINIDKYVIKTLLEQSRGNKQDTQI